MNWVAYTKIPKDIREALRKYDDLTAQLLFNRGIEDGLTAQKFFECSLNDLNDPYHINDIEKATKLILDKVKRSEKIYIYGDYDVDGVCSTSILFDFLYRKLGADVVPYIPSRFNEGYGMNSTALEKLKAEGASLIITVDCGIRDGELVEKFSQNGLDFIITDHHELPEDLDTLTKLKKHTKAIVHPGLSEKYDFKSICAGVVAWKLATVISDIAYKQKLITQKLDLTEYIDLAALATVCDIMPLTDENRIILKHGIEKMKVTQNQGLKELLMISGVISEEISPYHLGYIIGPRLNAAGRVKEALDAVRLLTSNNPETIREKARELTELNTERQVMTAKLLEDAEKQLDKFGRDKNLIFISGENWPEGIVGLVAGKLCEKYHKPTIVCSIIGDKATGSARSIKNFHITEAISESSDLLERFGGHAQAAGFTLSKNQINKFKGNLLEQADVISESDLEKSQKYDLELELKDVNLDLVKSLDQFAPFGFGNKQPKIVFQNLRITTKKNVGARNDHVKLSMESDGKILEVIGFGLAERFEKVNKGDFLNVLGYLEINNFMGNINLQLKLVDFKNVASK